MNFDDFLVQRDFGQFDLVLYGAKADIGGGTITKEEIDVLKEYPHIKSIRIMGLHQDTFDYFVNTYGHQFETISFFKNKMVTDLSALGQLRNVKYIYYYANQRAEKLWDMSANESLLGLSIDAFTRLHILDGIETAPNLQYFELAAGVWGTAKIETIKPLENSVCRCVSLGDVKVLDDDVSIFAQMAKLQQLEFPSGIFTTEQIAWLVAHMPNVVGSSLCAYVEHEEENEQNIFICGKRKPVLKREKDDARIHCYENKFNELVEMYKDMSYEEAFA